MIRSSNHVLIALAAAVAGSLLYFSVDPELSVYFPPCPFLSLTGLFCPGCGSQRAFHDLLHGNIFSSADHNLLFIAALPFVGYSAFVSGARLLFQKHFSQRLFHSTTFAIAVLVVVVVFWILRNIGAGPFVWLAP